MDTKLPPKKKNVVIVAGPDGDPIEQQSGKRLPAPIADIVGGEAEQVTEVKEIKECVDNEDAQK